MGYQDRDRHIIDYGMYELPGIRPHPGAGWFRGPSIKGPEYIACIGAAQTFGCFCAEPYPVLLRRALGIETLNLGYGGAGPTFHNSNAKLLAYINAARLVVVQVMSARSESNSLFRTRSHARDGIRVSDGAKMTAEEFYHELAITSPDQLKSVVAETRSNYVRDMRALLNDIRPPTVLFWFSVRSPDYQEIYDPPIWNFFGNFPQFVNRSVIEQIKDATDHYVECVSARGLPQPLFDKRGKPTAVRIWDEIAKREVTQTHNHYYPSPQMHVDGAHALVVVCRSILQAQRMPRPRQAPPSVRLP